MPSLSLSRACDTHVIVLPWGGSFGNKGKGYVTMGGGYDRLQVLLIDWQVNQVWLLEGM